MRNLVFVFSLAMLASGSASAVEFTVPLETTGAYGCASALGCDGSSPTIFDWNGVPTGSTGTVRVDESTGIMDLAIDIGLLRFEAVNGTDNGVASLLLSSLSYSATALSITNKPTTPTSNRDGIWDIDPGQTAQILIGIQTQLDELGSPVNSTPELFFALSVGIAGSCDISGLSRECTLRFGPTNYSIEVGSTVQDSRYFAHELRLVPEPSAALLIALGLAGLAIARSHRSESP